MYNSKIRLVFTKVHMIKTYHILTNDVHILILCLSYFIATVHKLADRSKHESTLVIPLEVWTAVNRSCVKIGKDFIFQKDSMYKRNAFKQGSLQFDLINRRTQDQKKMKRHLSIFLTLTILIMATSERSVITTLGGVSWPGLTLMKRHQSMEPSVVQRIKDLNQRVYLSKKWYYYILRIWL